MRYHLNTTVAYKQTGLVPVSGENHNTNKRRNSMEINYITLTDYAVYDLNGEYVCLVSGTRLCRRATYDAVWIGNRCICVVHHDRGRIDNMF